MYTTRYTVANVIIFFEFYSKLQIQCDHLWLYSNNNPTLTECWEGKTSWFEHHMPIVTGTLQLLVMYISQKAP